MKNRRLVDAVWLEEVQAAADNVAKAREVFDAAVIEADRALKKSRGARDKLREAGKIYQTILDSSNPGILDLHLDAIP